MREKLLSVENLRTVFKNKKKSFAAVDDLTFSIDRGKTLGIVGESGSGKTISALSVMGLLPYRSVIENGKIMFDGRDLLELNPKEISKLRGKEIAMIFQDPIMSLDQVFTVGSQITEAILIHEKISRKEAKLKAIKLLEDVEIADAERVFNSYPFELSGGMCQRIMIAIALSCEPKLLFADEPTTALDVTVQAQIMDLLKSIQKNKDTAIILITHDLGVVADMTDEIIVMYAGKVMERASTSEIFENAYHPYTLGLMKSIPRISNKDDKLYSIKGMVPDIQNLPKGCKFSNRCSFTTDKCIEDEPMMQEIQPEHFVRCHRADEIRERGLTLE